MLRQRWMKCLFKKIRFGLCEANRTIVIVFTIVTLLSGIVSAVLCRSNAMFYWCIRPSFCLPMILLVCLITISYLCIGAASGIVFSNRAPIFFLTCNIFVAFVDIIIVLFFSVILFFLHKHINFTAALLCGIYILILLYLSYLNFEFLILN